MNIYDAIVIGSGQGGNPLAKKLAQSGWKVALIEKRKVGGTCINDGCTPTKAMIASAKRAALTRKSQNVGVDSCEGNVDMAAVIHRKNEIVTSFRKSSEKQLKETENLDLIFGKATFSGFKEVEVALENKTSRLSAHHIFINTGIRTFIPPIEGLDQVNYLTSTTLLDLEEIPEHLLILGGGNISVEFAQMFRRFGSEVTIVEKESMLMAREDEDVIEEITRILTDEGISVITDARVEKVGAGSSIKVELQGKTAKRIVECSHMLVATGSVPNTDELNLSATKVETDERGFVKVNERLQTTVEGIFAIGDVKGGPKFTHVSYNDHVVIAKNLLENGEESIQNRLVPYCIFTDPQLGRVGITEKEAKKRGLEVKVAKLPMKYVARAIETGETIGFMKAIVDSKTKRILGAAILGDEGGETMSMLQMAMMGNVTYDKIRDSMFAHPTYAESLNNLFMTLDD